MSQIIEYVVTYQDQVIRLIDSILKELGVIPQSTKLIDDADLTKIPEVYGGRGRFWLALQSDTVIGTVAIRELSTNTAKLNRMFVKPDYRGTGVAQDLLNLALKFAGDQGFQEVILNTHLLMTRAHHFYEKNGFIKTGQKNEKYHYRLDLKKIPDSQTTSHSPIP